MREDHIDMKQAISVGAMEELGKLTDSLTLTRDEMRQIYSIFPKYRYFDDSEAIERVRVQKPIPPPIVKIKKGYIMDEFHLTEKEEEILYYLLEGYTPAAIAEKLCLSITTVKSHLNNIYTKKHVHCMQELIVGEYKKRTGEVVNIQTPPPNPRPQGVGDQKKIKKKVNIDVLMNEIF